MKFELLKILNDFISGETRQCPRYEIPLITNPQHLYLQNTSPLLFIGHYQVNFTGHNMLIIISPYSPIDHIYNQTKYYSFRCECS